MGAAIAALGATSAMVSLQDPDRPDPELTLTIGLDEAAQQAAVAAVADPGHPLTTAGRGPRRGARRARRSPCR